MGIVSPLGMGLTETRAALLNGQRRLGRLTVFEVAADKSMPVGQVAALPEAGDLPRTHVLARLAAAQAMAGCEQAVDAVIMGVTTGGMFLTEKHLKAGHGNPEDYKWHGAGTVAEDLAALYHCRGPALTISTACSSGSVAVKIGLEMIRSGKAGRVLVGGVDSLCRLTYYGFLSLQLIDPQGAAPFARNRRGMTVAEGAAMLLLAGDEPEKALAEIRGGGLSCDAYHPTAPHPEGLGALAAMRAALADAEIDPRQVDYVNLHGTGTPDNDRAEAKAVRALFGDHLPLLSSIKGACGHSLAASGAIEAVVAAMTLQDGLVPANTGCVEVDPELAIRPVQTPLHVPIGTVLSNSFGFGGNNAALVLAKPGQAGREGCGQQAEAFSILGSACITGRGDTEKTTAALRQGVTCTGMISAEGPELKLPARDIRRLKRLPRLTLSLAQAAHQDAEGSKPPQAVFFGTGWGALSDTHAFLTRLYATNEQFPSPTDFTGSVHNAPAGQIAMWFKAQGPNLTTTGGDYSFEQALLAAELCAAGLDDPILVAGADEALGALSGLFDPSVRAAKELSDGGGALVLTRSAATAGWPRLGLRFYANAGQSAEVMAEALAALGCGEKLSERYGLILAGIPAGGRAQGESQLAELSALSGFKGPVVDYRKWIGEFASASAVAAVLAVKWLEQGTVPGVLWGGADLTLDSKGILLLGLGPFVTVVELFGS